jgi:hypothetical protein
MHPGIFFNTVSPEFFSNIELKPFKLNIISLFYLSFETVSLCSTDWSQNCYGAQAGLEPGL